MIRQKSTGFSFLGVIIILAVVFLIIAVVWRVYAPGAGNNSNGKNISSLTDWRTYTATLKKLSFKYPTDWSSQVKKENDLEAAMITAPERVIDGKKYHFTMIFRIFKPTAINTGQSTVYNVNSVASHDYSAPIYSVISGALDTPQEPTFGKAAFVSLSDKSYPLGALDGEDITVTTNTRSGQEVEFIGSLTDVDTGTLAYFDPAKFAALEDVQTAVKVFSTLSDGS